MTTTRTTQTTATTDPGLGLLRAGLTTSAVAALSLVALVVASVVVSPPPGRGGPVSVGPDAVVAGGLVVLALAGLSLWLVRSLLRRRGALVASRGATAQRVVAAYAPLAVVVAALPLDPAVVGLALVALAMTAPGVLWTVLDGSSPRRGVARVALAVVLVPVAGVVGFLTGYGIASGGFVLLDITVGPDTAAGDALGVGLAVLVVAAGVLAGHLTTFLPLAAIGPGGASSVSRSTTSPPDTSPPPPRPGEAAPGDERDRSSTAVAARAEVVS